MKRQLWLAVIALFTSPAVAMAATIANPIGISDPRLIVARLIQAALSVSGTVALLMFIYSGLLFLTAGGRPGPVEKAKKILVWSIIGIVVIASAYVATTAVFNAVTTGNVTS
ncbi:MAG: hypothetical protein O3B64_02415 [bacterium]|nr:hypothetical protein [bacterium]MDA1024346.1 hypothetical protein [bacterium]